MSLFMVYTDVIYIIAGVKHLKCNLIKPRSTYNLFRPFLNVLLATLESIILK